jgi:alpha-D-ribose 1-methylphosphonate 5-triphosphate synthase subunit PhnH
MSTQSILFTSAARESQAVFRAVLQALARPGRIYQLPAVREFPRADARYGYAILAALADGEVSICLTGASEAECAFASLGTGARLSRVGEADYALALEDDPTVPISLTRGELETPEDGATLVALVRRIGADGLALSCAGPGVRSSTRLRVAGLSSETMAARNVACSAYPLGIDLILVDVDGRVAGIPRTTTVTVEVE